MPHDINGKPLKAGDKVTMTFEVKNIGESEAACNVTLEAIDPRQTGEYKPQVACNARLVQKVA